MAWVRCWREKAGQQPRPRVMLAAHLDEIGFMVQGVTAPGLSAASGPGRLGADLAAGKAADNPEFVRTAGRGGGGDAGTFQKREQKGS